MMQFGPERDVPVGFSVPASSSVCRGPRVGGRIPRSGAADGSTLRPRRPALGSGPRSSHSRVSAACTACRRWRGHGGRPPSSRKPHNGRVSAAGAGGQSAVPGTEPRVQETPAWAGCVPPPPGAACPSIPHLQPRLPAGPAHTCQRGPPTPGRRAQGNRKQEGEKKRVTRGARAHDSAKS